MMNTEVDWLNKERRDILKTMNTEVDDEYFASGSVHSPSLSPGQNIPINDELPFSEMDNLTPPPFSGLPTEYPLTGGLN